VPAERSPWWANGAKDNLEAALENALINAKERQRHTVKYCNTMATTCKLAEEEFQLELQCEWEELH
jgi:hypothetical protein